MIDRCAVCGCFLELYETSTESGTDVHERCNNKRCMSKQFDVAPFIENSLINGIFKIEKKKQKSK